MRSDNAGPVTNGTDRTWASMLDEAAGCDDFVTGLRSAMRGTKGKSANRLASVGAASTAKASIEGWRLRLRPNKRIIKHSAKVHTKLLSKELRHNGTP
jgi:hypothetical protein